MAKLGVDVAVRPPEYWVFRIWTQWHDDGKRYAVQLSKMTLTARATVELLFHKGTLAALPGDLIGEPVMVFDTEADAAAHMHKCQQAYPLEDFRVMMNVDLPDD